MKQFCNTPPDNRIKNARKQREIGARYRSVVYAEGYVFQQYQVAAHSR